MVKAVGYFRMSDKLLDQTYEIVSESVASENIEGEVIIVHFDTGTYFSLRNGASIAWDEVIENSVLPRDLIGRVEADDVASEDQIARFIGVLVDESVIRPSENAAGAVSSTDSIKLPDLVVEKYEDMQLLLLGDPIHEVESEGWPLLRDEDSIA